MKPWQSCALVVMLVALAACGSGGGSDSAPRSSVATQLSSASSIATQSSVISSNSQVSSNSQIASSISSQLISSSSSRQSSSLVSSTSNSSVSSSSYSGSSLSSGELLAFPGAEGFAAKVTGGRGGQVIKVTNLNASGPGSLAAALATEGKRIVVFEVSGSIKIPGENGKNGGVLYIGHGDVTIAGQTAPGGGITIEGRLYAPGKENIIMRHLRIRPEYDGSEGNQFDAIQAYYGNYIMMDHISVAFGVDESIDIYSSNNITVQWSTIESASMEDSHPDFVEKGIYHNYGLLSGSEGYNVSVLNNLFAHNQKRNPAISTGPADIVNNLIYNSRHSFQHDDPTLGGQFNVAGNYHKRGPSSILIPIWFSPDGDENERSYFVNDWVDTGGQSSTCDQGALTNPFTQCDNNDSAEFYEASVVNAQFNFSSVSGWSAPVITAPQESYDNVLAKAGAFPRDVITKRSVTETQNRTGSWGARRDDVDLMQGLNLGGSTPTDSDDDGMPNTWETAHGLNPNADDDKTIMPSGYTAIEEYINELADNLVN